MSARTAQLSERERQILRLVKNNFTSKQIAPMLGISHHTVDADMRHAISALGVATRDEAAEMLAAAEACDAGEQPYQRLIYQAPPVADAPENEALSLSDRNEFHPPWWLSFLRRRGRENDLTILQRLAWSGFWAVAIIVLFSQLATGLAVVRSIGQGLVN